MPPDIRLAESVPMGVPQGLTHRLEVRLKSLDQFRQGNLRIGRAGGNRLGNQTDGGQFVDREGWHGGIPGPGDRRGIGGPLGERLARRLSIASRVRPSAASLAACRRTVSGTPPSRVAATSSQCFFRSNILL